MLSSCVCLLRLREDHVSFKEEKKRFPGLQPSLHRIRSVSTWLLFEERNSARAGHPSLLGSIFPCAIVVHMERLSALAFKVFVCVLLLPQSEAVSPYSLTSACVIPTCVATICDFQRRFLIKPSIEKRTVWSICGHPDLCVDNVSFCGREGRGPLVCPHGPPKVVP